MEEGLREPAATHIARAQARRRGLVMLTVLLVSLFWRLPSLFDPPWVNDEGTYFAVAQAMAHGFALYNRAWENKPPALYLLYTAVYHSFGASLIAIRCITAVAVLGLVSTAWRLGTYFVGPEWSPSVALLTGLLFGVPFLEGTTGNAEVFVALFAALAVEQGIVRVRWWAAGILIGAAVLFKVVAAFDGAALGLALLSSARSSGNAPSEQTCVDTEIEPAFSGSGWAWGHSPYVTRTDHLDKWSRALAIFVGSSISVVAVACVLAAHAEILRGMIRDAFLYDVGYVGHGNGGGVPWFLALKVAVLIGLACIAWRRPFPILWLIFAAFGALFSGRLFGHYLLQAVVPLVLTLCLAFCRRNWSAQRLPVYSVGTFLSLALGAGLAGWLLAATGRDSIFARRLQYYPNFARYAIGAESYSTYRDEIDDHVARNEAIARALKNLPPGYVLVWGNTPWIYPLSGRLPATRYTSALRAPAVPGETESLRAAVLAAGPEEVVVIAPPMPPLGEARTSLSRRYRESTRIGNAVIYVRSAGS